MTGFNELAAAQVARIGQADFRLFGRPLAADGRLREKPVPRWVRRAVVAREHGRCARCDRPVGEGLLVPFVSLSAGGINDVTEYSNRVRLMKLMAPAESQAQRTK